MTDQFGGTPAQAAGDDALTSFVESFVPDADVVIPGEPFLDYGREHAPAVLNRLWAEHGVGFYGQQRIAIIDPGEWMSVLRTWLGEDVTSFPFAVTSFGHLYHYDQVDGRDRVQCLDPHFQTNTVVADDLGAFFDEHLPGQDSHVTDLEGPRGGALSILGPLESGEIYFFDPILALGGQVSPGHLAKGNGPEHLRTIHEKVLQQAA